MKNRNPALTLFKNFFLPFCLLALVIFTPSVYAIDLGTAKALGYVGEQADGYIGLTGKEQSTEIRELIVRVNAERQKLYAEIATRNGTDPTAVAQLAGAKATERTPSGQYVNAGAGWAMK